MKIKNFFRHLDNQTIQQMIREDSLRQDIRLNVGEISDGYHTFDELYYHRMILFAVICNTYKHHAWKSWEHEDGTMYDNYFIVGITTENDGDYSYHYHKDHWDMFDVAEVPRASKWDGHIQSDIMRLMTLVPKI